MRKGSSSDSARCHLLLGSLPSARENRSGSEPRRRIRASLGLPTGFEDEPDEAMRFVVMQMEGQEGEEGEEESLGLPEEAKMNPTNNASCGDAD